MVFCVKVTYEDDTTLNLEYRLRHIAKHFRKIKETGIEHMRALPMTPWLIAMAFEDSIRDTSTITVKCIEIQENTK